MIEIIGDAFKLLFVIVDKKNASNVVSVCKSAGAEGGTILQGRGSGKKSTKIFGVTVESEKAIVLCLLPDKLVDDVLAAVTQKMNLNAPNTGIAFIVNSRSICGISHMLENK